MLQGSLFGPVVRAGIYRQASRASGSVSGRQFHAFSPTPTKSSRLMSSPKIDTHLPSILGNMGMKLGLVRVAENVPLPCALSFRSCIHSKEEPEVDAGNSHRSMSYEQFSQESGNGVIGKPSLDIGVGRNLRSMGYDQLSIRERRIGLNAQPPFENQAGRSPMSMNYVQGLLHNSGVNGGPPHYQQGFDTGRMPRPLDDVEGGYPGRGNVFGLYNPPQLEANADIVHIKLMRNNSYVTLTDYKGNKKMSVSAGQVAAKGDKPGRYTGEAAAEYMGRVVKQMKIRSVVVKVSGFSYFRRKKDSILAFKDGFTHSRGDFNPVVYIEDTTRKPHNGCRRPKKRRI